MNLVRRTAILLLYWIFNLNPILILRIFHCKVGKNVYIGSNVFIELENAHLLEIADEVVISSNSSIILHDSSLNNICNDQVQYGKVLLNKNCYIGFGCILLPGTSVGKNTIVGAGSIVKGILKQNSVYIGSPAKFYCSIEDLIRKRRENKQNDLIYYINQIKWNRSME